MNPPNPPNDQEKFATYTRDSATGLDYANQRYYDNLIGRFTKPDPFGGSADQTNPQSWNRYAYAGNDPANNFDPNGLDSFYSEYLRSVGLEPNYGFNVGAGPTYVPCPGCTTTVYGTPDPIAPIGTVTYFFPPSSGSSSNSSTTSGGVTPVSLPVTPVTPPSVNTSPPCAPSGTAPDPTVYQQKGQLANSLTNYPYDPNGMSLAAGTLYNLVELYGFRRGGPNDAQVLYGGSPAYANYVFGVYLSAAGLSLPETLSAANDYAAARSRYPAGTVMDRTYTATPAVNIANITAGYDAQQTGTLCHK